MYCIKCGKPLPKDAIFCGKCGAKVTESFETSKSNVISDENYNSANVKEGNQLWKGKQILFVPYGELDLLSGHEQLYDNR